ncbi:hypothetical protein FQV37_2726 [Psychrobacter nivimaris]|uniref:Uncharacterized protein n=1 Tax=Psychrobacter nivimaris TaxID=281738 RepID=A0A6N7C0P7_9GAMM|nr:hypothetical protein FQV37_2726 [Psychrobacter nivimaris]
MFDKKVVRYERHTTKHYQTTVTCVFQSFYLSDWQGGCAFGGYLAIAIVV